MTRAYSLAARFLSSNGRVFGIFWKEVVEATELIAANETWEGAGLEHREGAKMREMTDELPDPAQEYHSTKMHQRAEGGDWPMGLSIVIIPTSTLNNIPSQPARPHLVESKRTRP